MRHLQSAVFLALATGLVSGLTMPAATVSHSHAAPAPAEHLHPVAHSHKTAVHRRASDQRATGQAHATYNTAYATGTPVAGHHTGSRHHKIALAPERASVTETIPPVPLINMHLAALSGSHESLVRQNQRTEADGLSRIEDDAQLNELRREKALVAVPVSASLRINEGLPMNRRYCR